MEAAPVEAVAQVVLMIVGKVRAALQDRLGILVAVAQDPQEVLQEVHTQEEAPGQEQPGRQDLHLPALVPALVQEALHHQEVPEGNKLEMILLNLLTL